MALHSAEYPPGFVEYIQPMLEARQRALRNLSSHERLLCTRMLELFPELGRGPNVDELATSSGLPTEHIIPCLKRLDAIDFLKYDTGTRQVLVLYPLSAIPCPHRVYLHGKQPLYAMWAGGAIAIPIVYGMGTEATITSVCGHCQQPLQFDITVNDDGAVSQSVVVETLREWDPLPTIEDRAFPHFIDHFWLRVQFFCNEEHFQLWKALRPDEQGFLITFAQSVRVCQTFYGNFFAVTENL